MKKVFLALVALIVNTFMFSCTMDSVADTNQLYDTQATEGDDESYRLVYLS